MCLIITSVMLSQLFWIFLQSTSIIAPHCLITASQWAGTGIPAATHTANEFCIKKLLSEPKIYGFFVCLFVLISSYHSFFFYSYVTTNPSIFCKLKCSSGLAKNLTVANKQHILQSCISVSVVIYMFSMGKLDSQTL